MIPALRLQAIYDLVAQLRNAQHPEPVVAVLGLWFFWNPRGSHGGVVTVSEDDDPSEAPARCTIHAGGRLGNVARWSPTTVLSLRNFSAHPLRYLRREGQESGYCPLCRTDISALDLDSMIGYCRSCADRLGWPHNERAARDAEDALRREIHRELDEES